MTTHFRTYVCIVCGFMYDEQIGRPEDGILQAPHGLMCQRLGLALSVVFPNQILKWLSSNLI